MSSRNRKSINLQFDLNKPEDRDLLLAIQDLKSGRSFTKSIRVGVRLFWSLTVDRSIDYLLSEFGWVEAHIQRPMVERIAALEEQLAELKEQLNYPIDMGMLAVQEQLNRMEARLNAAPEMKLEPINRALSKPVNLEDDERLNLTVGKAQATDENPTYNMLISVASIDATGFIGLDLEVLEYGIKQGKIPAHFLEQKRALLAARNGGETQPTMAITIEEVNQGPKQISGAGIELAAPDLNMDDLDIGDW